MCRATERRFDGRRGFRGAAVLAALGGIFFFQKRNESHFEENWKTMSVGMSDRERLSRANDRLDEATDDIRSATEMTAHIIDLEMETLNELDRQHDVLLKDNDIMSGIDEKLDESQQILKRMMRRAINNKVALVGMFILFFVALIGSLYVIFKYFN